MCSLGGKVSELPRPGLAGICPHCGHDVAFINPTYHYSGEQEPREIKIEICYNENGKTYQLIGSKCPNPKCKKLILIRQRLNTAISPHDWEDDLMLWPIGIHRTIPQGFPSEIERDFKEACGTLYVSKRASAALSRRCLQNLLREKEKVHKNTLYEEIEDVLNANTLASPLQDTLHMIRNLGAVGTHPLKDSTTGKILDIEEGEAELMIDALTDLLDYYARIEKYKTTATTAQEKVNKQKKPPKKK
jgi:hypothetical protein